MHIIIINTTVSMKVVNRLNPKSSYQEKKLFFPHSFNVVSIRDDGYSLNIL